MLARSRQRRRQRYELLAIGADPALHARARPVDVAVLEQRHQVVADRAGERVLKIDDAGVAARQHASGCANDSRDARTPAAAPAPRASGTRSSAASTRAVGVIQRQLQVTRAEPLRHQCHLALQRGAIVGRQRAQRPRGPGAGCAAAPAVHRCTARQHRRRRAAAPGTARIPGPRAAPSRARYRPHDTCGTCTSQRLEQRGDLQERRDVLLVGRRIHHHARRAVGGPGAKVAPEAGIGRSRLEPQQRQTQARWSANA